MLGNVHWEPAFCGGLLLARQAELLGVAAPADASKNTHEEMPEYVFGDVLGNVPMGAPGEDTKNLLSCIGMGMTDVAGGRTITSGLGPALDAWQKLHVLDISTPCG